MMERDVVIIGAGIAGASAAMYLKRMGMDVILVEKGPFGGVLNKITEIENYPGYRNVSGPEIAMNMYEQINNLKINYLSANVTKIDDMEDYKIIKTDNGDIKTKYVVVATGRKERKLGIKNEEELTGRGISFCALCDGNFYKNKDVMVVGGGSSALEEAIYLARICSNVTLIHRKNCFSGEAKLIEEVKENNKIKIIYEAEVKEINEEDGILANVKLSNGEVHNISGLFICIGYVPQNEFVDVAKENGYIVINDKYETNIKNIFAIGDAIKKPYYQLVSATNDALVVSNVIVSRLK